LVGMVEHPGASYTVLSLAKCAGLSRSAFMDRFRRTSLSLLLTT
jgi:AraC-like DNA-binding protein